MLMGDAHAFRRLGCVPAQFAAGWLARLIMHRSLTDTYKQADTAATAADPRQAKRVPQFFSVSYAAM